jgi:hypothetical protein
VKEEVKTDEEGKEDDKPQILKDSRGQVIKVPEKKEDTVAKDSYGRVIKATEKAEPKKDVKMIAGATEKKRIGGIDDEENE